MNSKRLRGKIRKNGEDAMKKTVFFILFFIILNFFVFAEETTFSLKVLPVPPLLSASIDFKEPSGNKILDAEETGKLILNSKIPDKGMPLTWWQIFTIRRISKG